MKLRTGLVAVVATGLLSTGAFAVGPAQDPTIPTQWDENPYYNGFGGPLPSGIVEGSVGFSTIGDYDGRVISNAGLTKASIPLSPLTTISTGLYSGTDVNTYAIYIASPALFTASIPSTTDILSLYDSTGKALEASIGGATDPLTGVGAGITTPGIYYISITDSNTLIPQNAGGQDLFGIGAGAAGVYPGSTLADPILATDPLVAFKLPSGQTFLLQNSSFTNPGSTITLTGTDFAVPEPASLGLIAAGVVGLLGRRRRSSI